ncbi:MAG: type II secretion system protein GspJ [Deltaproteobacteria bacterium]|nr:type II secretion system protein GspJ [Deltaproteobacteria bacterium]
MVGCFERRNAGFTLLEILIAIAILALVVSSLYGAYSGTLDTTEKVENSRDVDQVARVALMQMVDDFKSLYYQKAKGEDEASPYSFGGVTEVEGEGGAIVAFATTSRLDFDMTFPSQRINRVSYIIEKQPDDEKLYRLVRRELPFADLSGERQEVVVEIADGVESLSLNYFDEEGQQFNQWDSKAEGLLPRLVRIRLRMAGDKSRVFYTSVAIRPQEGQDSG